ncbi:MAG TPA: glycine cleavage system aminomethyltransferase GcvT [Acidimicrobiia bacterium]
MNRSPIHDLNVGLGARFTDFGGWEMPLRYDSVIAEHKAVRTSAGFFDVSHLGRFDLTGPGAHAAIRRLLSNDIDRIEPGRTQYTTMLNESGGIVDDLIVWWLEPGRFRVMPNAANHEKVMAAFAAEPDTSVIDMREGTVLVAVQGPAAPEVLEHILGVAPRRFRTATCEFQGTTVEMAGTGYTGEKGAEVCLDPQAAQAFVSALVELDVVPCGLGARDTLRLEAGLALWGEDIDEATTPLEAGLDFAVSMDHDFVGREALARQAEEGLTRRLIGFVLEDRGVPRHGYRIRSAGGSTGTVTSGNMSPMIEMGIGLAYLSPGPGEGEGLEVEIRDRWVPARQAEPPFHED